MSNQIGRMLVLVALVLGASLSFSSSASAQVYVNVRPTFAPVVRPAPPSPRHVWVDEDWEYRGGRYVSVGGHWVAPPRPGMAWVPGRWVHYRRGWQWRPGHWRRM